MTFPQRSCTILRYVYQPSIWTPQEESPGVITVSDLCMHYGPVVALHKAAFNVERGEVVGLLGPNGAGKSTLLKILLGLLPPSSGSGFVLGHVLGEDSAALRRAIGYMPESDALVPGLRGSEYVALAG